MMSRPNPVRLVPRLALLGFILAAAGCQSSDGPFSGAKNDAPPPPSGAVLESELRAYCPPIVLREGTAFYRTYAKGAQDDPQKLVYQASIADVTRDCKREGGMMTINVAIAGKVVTGPAGAPGKIRMPIRVVAVKGDEVLYTKLHQYELAVGNTPGATQFVFNDPGVVIPVPEPGTIQLFAGYDEGPPAAN